MIEAMGGRYVSDEPSHGGFSAGYAGLVRTTSGRTFVKAVAAGGHADSMQFLRREIAVLELLPDGAGPALHARIDDDSGVAALLEPIDGTQPGAPWSDADLGAVASRLRSLAHTTAPSSLRAAGDSLIPAFTRWPEISASSTLLAGLPPGIRERMPRLLDLGTAFADAIAGDALMHGDLRADNLLIDVDGARLVDWPHAARAAPWTDLPIFLPSVEAAGGPSCGRAWTVFEGHGAPAPESMLPVIAGVASFFWFQQSLPEIPQLPGLRAFQRAQAVPALRWLSTLLSN
ncbi:phosphotransferase family protein [Microbacterium sp. NPDC056234]|uniref:phosphotransferase family protein n=1 Tax=Microbacterium sp. NPDC056234 TaxID=3345757 RepID=UPI0035DE68FF